MLPLPKLFDATRAPDISDGFKFQIIPGGDPLVDQIISGAGLSGLVGASAFISATAPTVITTTVVVDVSFTFGVSTATITTTSVVPAAISEAIIAGAATGGIILLVIALGIVADLQSKAQAERNLEKQRDAIDKLNNQIDELNKKESILREKLQNHLDDQEKLLSQKVTNFKNITNTYQVKQGDNLNKIAASNGISLTELLNANPQFSKELLYNQNPEFGIAHQLGRNPNLIFPGEFINIPNNPISQINQNSNFYSNSQLNITPALAKELGLSMKLQTSPELMPKTELPDHSQLIEILINSSIYDTYKGKILPIEETDFLKLLQEGFKAVQSAKLNTDATDILQNIIESLQNTLSSLTDEQYQNLLEGIIDHNYTYRWLNPQGLIINWILDDMLVQTQGKVENISDYLNRSLAQVLKGSFTDEDDVTALGSFSEIAIGIAAGAYGVDAPLDIRDILGDAYQGNYGQAILGILSLPPVIGALKGVKLILKYVDIAKFKRAINGANWDWIKNINKHKLNFPKLLKTKYAKLSKEFDSWDETLKEEFILDFGNVPEKLNELNNDIRLAKSWKDNIRSSNIKELSEGFRRANIREEYVNKVKNLESLKNQLKSNGKELLLIAKLLFEERRILTIKYKEMTPSDLEEWIFKRNESKYLENGLGDKWGLSWEGAKIKNKEFFEKQGIPYTDNDVYERIANSSHYPVAENKIKLGDEFRNYFRTKITSADFKKLEDVLIKYRMK